MLNTMLILAGSSQFLWDPVFLNICTPFLPVSQAQKHCFHSDEAFLASYLGIRTWFSVYPDA